MYFIVEMYRRKRTRQTTEKERVNNENMATKLPKTDESNRQEQHEQETPGMQFSEKIFSNISFRLIFISWPIISFQFNEMFMLFQYMVNI